MNEKKMPNETDMSNKPASLPTEVLVNIFKFFGVSDLAAISLVCRRWHQVAEAPVLWNKANICIFKKEGIFPKILLDSLERRCVKHLVFRSQTHGDQIQQVCGQIGHELLSLTITNCRHVDRAVLKTIQMTCTQLKALNLSSCRWLTGEYIHKKDLNGMVFPLVEEVNINGCGKFQKVLLESFSSVFPNMTKVHLSGSKGIFSEMWDHLSAVCWRLQMLELTRTDINDVQLKRLADLSDLNLQELTLTACFDITDEGVVFLASKQVNIEVLKLACLNISEKALRAIGKHLKCIRWLDLNGCRQITATSLQYVKMALTTIEYINLCSCCYITSEGFLRCFSNLDEEVSSYPLNTVILNGCGGVTDNVVAQLSVNFRKITHLNLISCFAVSDASLAALTENCQSLEILKVGWCSRITDNGLLGTCGDYCDKKHQSNMCNCGVERLKKLRWLDLSHCLSITDKGLQAVHGLTSLETLNVMMCSKISDAMLFGLAKCNKALKNLYLSGCRITDRGLSQLAANLCGLQTVGLSQCDSITNTGVLNLVKHCSYLKDIDLKFCNHVSEQDLPSLQSYLPCLSRSPFFLSGKI